MSRKRYSAEQIIGMLREAEVLLSQGKTAARYGRSTTVDDVVVLLTNPMN